MSASPSSRRPVTRPDPLRVVRGRAAERLASAALPMVCVAPHDGYRLLQHLSWPVAFSALGCILLLGLMAGVLLTGRRK